jgi:pantoate--beta-alanine ligase
MIIFKKAEGLRKWLDLQVEKRNEIGFVPTMGALHKGHLSLIEKSLENNKVTVCSIFINPTQFNDQKDFQNYPVTIEQDIYMLQKAGCDCLFLPSIEEIYPQGISEAKKIHYDLGFLEDILEGKFRPGHFQGVCLVVDRLLRIVEPGNLYLGQKDYQQCMVIKKLIELTGMKTSIVICPTLRERDGLAMSSRNLRLTESQRKNATAIFRALNDIKDNFETSDPAELKSRSVSQLESAGFSVDYVEIADAENLLPVTSADNKQVVALVAAFLGEIRLIDNMQIN